MQKNLKRSKVETSENPAQIPAQKSSKKIRQNTNHPQSTTPTSDPTQDQPPTLTPQLPAPKDPQGQIVPQGEIPEDYIRKSTQCTLKGNGTLKGLPVYINELICYPKGESRGYIVNFRQLLYENLLADAAEPRTIVSAFMTTFGFESKQQSPFAMHLEKFLLINEANSQSTKIERDYCGVKNWTLILSGKPNTAFGSGAYHPKLWQQKFPKMLRVVIGSGNLTIGDWTAWSNCLWFKDLPLKTGKENAWGETPVSGNDLNQSFKDYQKFFLASIIPEVNKSGGLDRLLKDANIDLDEYIYQDIFYELIGSCPGTYDVTDGDLTFGFNKLANIMKKNPPTFPFDIKTKKITYVTSSLGTIDSSLIRYFIGSLYPEASKTLTKEDYPNLINVVFPTMKYVEDSPFDKQFACCLFLNTEVYDKPWFIKDCLCAFEANPEYCYSDGVIPHQKVMIVTDDDYTINDDTVIYFGSHNCTRSAWGKLEKGNSKISLSNTELGCVYPARVGSSEVKKNIVRSLSFNFPPRKLAENEKPFQNDVFFGRRNVFQIFQRLALQIQAQVVSVSLY